MSATTTEKPRRATRAPRTASDETSSESKAAPKIEVEAAAFRAAVAWVSRNILTPRLEIAQRVRLSAADGRLIVSGTDFETTTRTSIPASEGEFPTIAVGSAMLERITGRLTGAVTLLSDGKRLHIQDSARHKYQLSIPTDDYVPHAEPQPIGSADLLPDAVAAVINFIDPDANPGVLRAIRMITDPAGAHLWIDATDRYRAARWVLPWDGKPITEGILINGARAVAALRGMGETRTLLLDANSAGFTDGTSVAVITRSASSTQNDWPEPGRFGGLLTPKPKSVTLDVVRADLIAAIEDVAITITRDAKALRHVIIEGDAERLAVRTLDGADTPAESMMEPLDAAGRFASRMAVEYILDALKALPHTDVRLWMTAGMDRAELHLVAIRGLTGKSAPDGSGPLTDDDRMASVMPVYQQQGSPS